MAPEVGQAPKALYGLPARSASLGEYPRVSPYPAQRWVERRLLTVSPYPKTHRYAPEADFLRLKCDAIGNGYDIVCIAMRNHTAVRMIAK